jgi:2-oxoglutarate dehydrogenase E1 component
VDLTRRERHCSEEGAAHNRNTHGTQWFGNLEESHLEQVFDTGHLGGPKRAPLDEIIDILRATYCSSIGAEYMHIQDRTARRWLQTEMEPIRNRPELERDGRLHILEQLIDAARKE